VEEKSALLEELRGAIEDDQFHLQYQPIIDTVSSKIVGFEALLRWNHPRLGVLAPGRFIDIAESAGLIGPLGDWVLNQACRDAMDWPESMSVAVNISPAQFASNTLAASVKAALKHSGLSPRRLELEITEAVFIQREMMVEQFIHEMNRLGVGIALDDFGTGYSSLAYLTRFPVQKLKIDSSFISGKRAFRERNAIVAAIVGIARTLDMAVTAEGVEKDAELAWVSSLGCRLVQGYYFARPMDSENIASYIENFSFRHLRGKFKVV
jgi:EAL domain-containing protein (putative c-di-GMP-specific phosphodiesterase class I)